MTFNLRRAVERRFHHGSGCARALGYRLLLLLLILPGVTAAAVSVPVVAAISSGEATVYSKAVEACSAYLQDAVPDIKVVLATLGKGSDSNMQLHAIQAQQADLIFTLGRQATQLAVRSFPDKPIVATMLLSLQEFDSQANVTGVVLEFPPSTQLQMLQRMLPDAKHIGVLYDPANNQAWVDSALKVAQQQGLILHPIQVANPKVLPAALRQLARSADVLWAIPDQTVFSQQTIKPILLSSFRNRIPVIGLSTSWVKAGALYALGADYEDLGRQSCALASQILRGSAIEMLPVQSPRNVTYSLNLKTARHMKFEMANEVIKGAAKIYE